MGAGVTILGIFVADTSYLAHRMPDVGETIKGSGFAVGPGGKGSNQAVAAAKAGAEVSFISKIGRDTFGDLAQKTYADAGV
ncbi:PfkB family carbohydrate kinase, partial [Rhizobium sp. VS19-DR121]